MKFGVKFLLFLLASATVAHSDLTLPEGYSLKFDISGFSDSELEVLKFHISVAQEQGLQGKIELENNEDFDYDSVDSFKYNYSINGIPIKPTMQQINQFVENKPVNDSTKPKRNLFRSTTLFGFGKEKPEIKTQISKESSESSSESEYDTVIVPLNNKNNDGGFVVDFTNTVPVNKSKSKLVFNFSEVLSDEQIGAVFDFSEVSDDKVKGGFVFDFAETATDKITDEKDREVEGLQSDVNEFIIDEAFLREFAGPDGKHIHIDNDKLRQILKQNKNKFLIRKKKGTQGSEALPRSQQQDQEQNDQSSEVVVPKKPKYAIRFRRVVKKEVTENDSQIKPQRPAGELIPSRPKTKIIDESDLPSFSQTDISQTPGFRRKVVVRKAEGVYSSLKTPSESSNNIFGKSDITPIYRRPTPNTTVRPKDDNYKNILNKKKNVPSEIVTEGRVIKEPRETYNSDFYEVNSSVQTIRPSTTSRNKQVIRPEEAYASVTFTDKKYEEVDDEALTSKVLGDTIKFSITNDAKNKMKDMIKKAPSISTLPTLVTNSNGVSKVRFEKETDSFSAMTPMMKKKTQDSDITKTNKRIESALRRPPSGYLKQ